MAAAIACDARAPQAPAADAAADAGPEPWTVLEIQDDPRSPTLAPCDGGMLATPGADIDAAELLEVDVVVATLTACSLASQSPCKNDLADAENAQGPPDNDYYFNTTSLNGGTLRCRWSGGEALTLGRTVRVIEIGGVDAGLLERFRIRACRASGQECTAWSEYRNWSEPIFTAESLF